MTIFVGFCCTLAGILKLVEDDKSAMVWIVLGNLHFFVWAVENDVRKMQSKPKDKIPTLGDDDIGRWLS